MRRTLLDFVLGVFSLVLSAILLAGMLLGLTTGCDRMQPRVDEQEPKSRSGVELLAEKIAERCHRADELRLPHGWLVGDDDGMLWSALEAARPCGETQANILAAEHPADPGRFCRHPGPGCFETEGTDRTTWSRDMGKGFQVWAWRTKNLGAVERHAAYGRAHQLTRFPPTWQMGTPIGDGRVVYTPAMIGTHYEIQRALGGDDHTDRRWPNVYPTGLDDYQAHLQVLEILLRGEIETGHGLSKAERHLPSTFARWPLSRIGGFNSVEVLGLLGHTYHNLQDCDGEPSCIDFTQTFAPADISQTMFDRLKEHAERESENPLYAFAYGRYTGDQSRTLDLCLRPEVTMGTYTRCDRLEACALAEWLFTCGSLLDDLKRN